MNKTPEYWIALIAASLYVFRRSNDQPLLARLSVAVISGALGHTLTPEIALATGRPEILTMVVITATVYLVLDFVSALFADRALLLEMVRKLIKK